MLITASSIQAELNSSRPRYFDKLEVLFLSGNIWHFCTWKSSRLAMTIYYGFRTRRTRIALNVFFFFQNFHGGSLQAFAVGNHAICILATLPWLMSPTLFLNPGSSSVFQYIICTVFNSEWRRSYKVTSTLFSPALWFAFLLSFLEEQVSKSWGHKIRQTLPTHKA